MVKDEITTTAKSTTAVEYRYTNILYCIATLIVEVADARQSPTNKRALSMNGNEIACPLLRAQVNDCAFN